MIKRRTGFDTLPNFMSATGRVRSLLDLVSERANTCLERAKPYRDRLVARVRKHPKLASGIDAVSNGWSTLIDHFCAAIDPCLSKYFPDMRLVAIVTPSSEVELHKVVKVSVTPLGRLATIDSTERIEIAQTKWTAIELRLPPDRILKRTLSLPPASRDFLDPIIEHRLERLTPWRPDRVLYGYHTLSEPHPGGGVGVALAATSKDFVAEPLHALHDCGLVPTAIGSQENSLLEPLQVDLLRGAARATRTDSRRMVSRLALATFCILTITCIGSSIWLSSEREHQRDASGKLMKARRLLKAASMDAVGNRERIILEAKQPDKSVVVLIDNLANVIPEDTYLKELAVTRDKVRLSGISSNAPALIGSIERTGLVNVRFGSAVTREKDQKDAFEITADRPASRTADSP